MQLAGDGFEEVFLQANQTSGQHLPFFGQPSQVAEDSAIVRDHVSAGQKDRGEDRRHEVVSIALDAIVDALNLGGGSLLSFVIGHQKSRHRVGDRSMPRLKNLANQAARFAIVAMLGGMKHALHVVPKISERVA